MRSWHFASWLASPRRGGGHGARRAPAQLRRRWFLARPAGELPRESEGRAGEDARHGGAASCTSGGMQKAGCRRRSLGTGGAAHPSTRLQGQGGMNPRHPAPPQACEAVLRIKGGFGVFGAAASGLPPVPFVGEAAEPSAHAGALSPPPRAQPQPRVRPGGFSCSSLQEAFALLLLLPPAA